MPGLDRFSLDNEVVLITAGTSRYGQHIVRDVAQAGATVIMTSRNKEAAEKIALEQQERGHNVKPARFDLGDLDTTKQLCDHIRSNHGQITGLVNNAVARPMSYFDDDISAWQQSMKRNATGLFALTREIAHQMADGTGGSIINISSIQGMHGPDERLYEGTDMYNGGERSPPPDYFFHKGGILNLTRYFAAVFGNKQVRVNAVSPGGIKSQGQNQTFVKNYERRTALGRLAEGDDVSSAVVFLLSDAASYITGINIPVDGGYSII
jgi:NAD(P)-dependent dehydrogenase (short-subunit alcohol dehydrogenase family)